MFKASYNEHKSCPGTSLLTGSCVSGKDADCEGHFNALYCQNGMHSQRVIHVSCKLIISVFVCFLYVCMPLSLWLYDQSFHSGKSAIFSLVCSHLFQQAPSYASLVLNLGVTLA